ncbi:MAG: hypothetical protein HYV33_06475 [Candidatus Kerfeldbacteria bacterium]|nr:hypothetical protein [Candidatus Kerfeldbacteria bacterium]
MGEPVLKIEPVLHYPKDMDTSNVESVDKRHLRLVKHHDQPAARLKPPSVDTASTTVEVAQLRQAIQANDRDVGVPLSVTTATQQFGLLQRLRRSKLVKASVGILSALGLMGAASERMVDAQHRIELLQQGLHDIALQSSYHDLFELPEPDGQAMMELNENLLAKCYVIVCLLNQLKLVFQG